MSFRLLDFTDRHDPQLSLSYGQIVFPPQRLGDLDSHVRSSGMPNETSPTVNKAFGDPFDRRAIKDGHSKFAVAHRDEVSVAKINDEGSHVTLSDALKEIVMKTAPARRRPEAAKPPGTGGSNRQPRQPAGVPYQRRAKQILPHRYRS
jgi:hypothetical protein